MMKNEYHIPFIRSSHPIDHYPLYYVGVVLVEEEGSNSMILTFSEDLSISHFLGGYLCTISPDFLPQNQSIRVHIRAVSDPPSKVLLFIQLYSITWLKNSRANLPSFAKGRSA